MQKKLILPLLSIILLFTAFGNPVFASSNNADSKENILSKVDDIESKTDVIKSIELSDLPEDTDFVEFDSVEEFENAVKDLEKKNNKHQLKIKDVASKESQVMQEKTPIQPMASTTKVLNLMLDQSFNPLLLNRPNSMTVDLSYSYHNRKFTSINNVYSYNIGFPMNWNQTSYSPNIYSNGNSVRVNLNGYQQLGVEIGGFPIGYRISDPVSFTYSYGGSTTIRED